MTLSWLALTPTVLVAIALGIAGFALIQPNAAPQQPGNTRFPERTDAMKFGEPKEELGEIRSGQVPVVSELARRYAARVESAWMGLVYVMPPVMRKDILAEVAHRRSLMGEAQAIESVRDDLATGRWQP